MHTLYNQGCKAPSCGRRRLCANAQADLSLRWSHMSEGTFSHGVCVCGGVGGGGCIALIQICYVAMISDEVLWR